MKKKDRLDSSLILHPSSFRSWRSSTKSLSRSTMSEMEFRPGLADVPCAESAISFIDGKRARLEYRGIAVETLARDSCFEETAWLLLRGELPTKKELGDFDH